MNRRATTTGCVAGVYTTVGTGYGKSPATNRSRNGTVPTVRIDRPPNGGDSFQNLKAHNAKLERSIRRQRIWNYILAVAVVVVAVIAFLR
jgi:hypothetical protein